VPDEVAAAQQPLPTKPAPFARQRLTEDLLTTRTPESHQWAVDAFHKFRSEGQFVPFSVGKDTVMFPGFDGGAEWGGPAVDAETGIIYINANDFAWTGALAPNTGEHSPKAIYMSQCSVCHGENMTGSPPALPSLIGVEARLKSAQITATIKNGKGRMPGFPNLSDDETSALLGYLTSGENKELASSGPTPPAMKYRFTGYRRFLDPEGYPAVVPPWGTLNAINLNTGEYVWKIPLGEYPELAAVGQKDMALKSTGTENYGGPVVTAGGLLFIGATNFDKKFRAFDKATGELLWESTLPFAGNATPVTYEVNGRQFVVIAAGGGKDPKSKSGGVYVAFALPKQSPSCRQRQGTEDGSAVSLQALRRSGGGLGKNQMNRHFSRHQAVRLAHQSPVIFVGDSAARAYLVVAALVIDPRPRKTMGATFAQQALQEVHGVTARLRLRQTSSQRWKNGLGVSNSCKEGKSIFVSWDFDRNVSTDRSLFAGSGP
jgi:mono/diheme cytochrome c family protein